MNALCLTLLLRAIPNGSMVGFCSGCLAGMVGGASCWLSGLLTG